MITLLLLQGWLDEWKDAGNDIERKFYDKNDGDDGDIAICCFYYYLLLF